MFEKIIMRVIWLVTVLPFLAVSGYVLYLFTMEYTAFAAQTDPIAVVILPIVALLAFVKLAKSVMTDPIAE